VPLNSLRAKTTKIGNGTSNHEKELLRQQVLVKLLVALSFITATTTTHSGAANRAKETRALMLHPRERQNHSSETKRSDKTSHFCPG